MEVWPWHAPLVEKPESTMKANACATEACHGVALMLSSISGLVVEYIVAIDVTRVRFPADALFQCRSTIGEKL